jgi:hypothetical protein
MTRNPTRGRLTLLAIAALFALPILASMYFYFSDAGWRPGERIQHGDLISPPRTLPDGPLTHGDNSPRFREVWSLVVLTETQCDATCVDALEKIRQVRLWLGPKINRLQTVVLPTDSAILTEAMRAEHPKLIIAEPSLSQSSRSAIGGYNNGQIFMVDPLGNLMMSYKPGVDMGDIRKDIGHLLRISNIG